MMNEEYDVVIGWDFGDGENAADVYRREQKRSTELQLDLQKNRQIPTVILYCDGEIKIGSAAGRKPEAIAYFKARPDRWDSSIAGHRKKDIMFDFFKTMMSDIRRFNPDFVREGDRIRLYVGCPSSRSWLFPQDRLRAYEQLISKATGIKHVVVVPESRAALYSAFSMLAAQTDRNDAEQQETPARSGAAGPKQVNTTHGAIIFDFGSSTADFTYMKLGKYLIERSWTLGASEIEKGMLKAILRDNGITPGDVWEQEISRLTYDLREKKERYFSEGTAEKTSLTITALDGNGDPVVIRRNEKNINQVRFLEYYLDDDFMDEITKEYRFPVEENDNSLGEHSWVEHCERFFRSMKQMLDRKNLPYETIVLSGGACRMAFIKTLCESVFGREVILEINPSHSVSKGLCFLGKTDLNYADIVEESCKEVVQLSDRAFEEMLDTCSDSLAEKAYGCVRETLAGVASGPNITIGDLETRISVDLKACMTNELVTKKILQPYGKWIGECKEAIVTAANNATQKIYPDSITAGFFKLSGEDDYSFMSDLEINIDGATVLQGFDLAAVATKIISTVIKLMLIVIACIINLLLGLIVAVVYELVEDWFLSNKSRVLYKADRKTVYKKFMNREPKEKKKIAADIRKSLGEALNKTLGESNAGHNEHLSEATRTALGVISLRTFEHRE